MKSYLFLVAILLGFIFPQGHAYTFLIKYNLMVMLFYAFLNMDFQQGTLAKPLAKVLIFNLLLPVFWFLLIDVWDRTLALVAFVVAVAPTAAAAPIVSIFLKSRVDIVTAAVLVNSIAVACFIPFTLPHFTDIETEIKILDVLIPVFIVVFVPLLLSKLSIQLHLKPYLNKGKDLPFYLFMLNLFIASGKARHYISYETTASAGYLLSIAAATFLVGWFNFQIGMRLGDKSNRLAYGLALGRKNTMFALWLSLTFVSPIVALAPIFYIIFQNIFNTYQVFQMERAAK